MTIASARLYTTLGALVCALAVSMPAPPAMGQRPAKQQPAPTPKLALGDPAPTLSLDLWLKGEAAPSFEPGRVYVVEFWATWCGPCKKSIPHLNELQKRYGDRVQIIGVSDEERETVQDYLDAEQKDLAYTIATDPSAATKAAFMDAYGAQGIPTAFLVDKQGRLAWVGHPTRLDPWLDAVVEDAFDAVAYQRWQQEHDDLEARLKEAAKVEAWPSAVAILDEMIALHARESSDLYGNAIAHQRRRFEILVAKLAAVEEGYAYGEALLAELWDNPNELNNFAWFIVDNPEVPSRDLDLAMRASVRSNILSHGKNAAYLDTLARVYFEAGDLDSALRYQEAAVEHAGSRPSAEITQALQRYREMARSGAAFEPSTASTQRNRKGLWIPQR